MKSLTVLSPAKVNLSLHVTGRYPNGYHELLTVFHRISLLDKIRLTRTKTGVSLRTNWPGLPTDERNLITKAYRMIQERFPDLGGVHVDLHKKIPVGAGLGGGSSNAAFFLLAMNRLYKLGLSRRQLVLLGKRLGADVPFFLYDTNRAIGEGRGDKIQPRPLKRSWNFVLVIDSKGLSTKEVFEKYRLEPPSDSLTKPKRTARMLCTFLDRGNPSALIPLLHNDLEKPAFSLRQEIRKKIQKLHKAGFSCVRMSGSGPTIFILLPMSDSLESAVRRVKKLLPSARVEGVKTF